MAVPTKNPEGCCGIKTDCCLKGIPDILKLKLNDLAGCPAIDGVVVKLKLIDPDTAPYPSWEGSMDSGQCGMFAPSFHLQCNGVGPTGFTLYSSSSPTFSWALKTAECEPDLELVFESDSQSIDVESCCSSNPVQLEATIEG